MLDVTVFGEVDGPFKPRGQVARGLRHVARIVEDYGVKLHAGLEAARAEESSAARGAQPEGLRGRQGGQALVHQPPAELRDLYGVRHGAENRGQRPSRDVAAQARAQAHVQKSPHGGDAARNVHVRGRAVGDMHSALAYELQLRLFGEHAVCHDRVAAISAEEAVFVIGRAVKGAPGAELAHELHLSPVLGQVRLHRQAALALYGSQLAQECVGAAGYEAGRQHGLRPLIAALGRLQPASDGTGRARGVRLPQAVRRARIHADLAHHGDEAAFFQHIHEQQRRLHVRGGKDAGAGVRPADHVLDKAAVGARGVVQIGKAALLREGAGVQPVKQLHVHTRAAICKLRSVDVQVHKAGQDQATRAVEHRQARVLLRQSAEHPCGAPVLTDGVAALHALQLPRREAVADVALYCKTQLCHRSSP